MRAKEILKIVQGKLVSGDPNVDIDPSKISTDSRTIKGGDFFIALKGESFDGNDFVEIALKRGAIGALVTNYTKEDRKVIIQTQDTTKALQNIASHYRMKFRIPVIGVTGSNGKTAVKEMI